MKQLLVMRHAKSSWKDETLADHDRPLNPRGQDNAPRMGQFVAENKCLPDLILSSTAARALQTARLFVEGCGCDIEILTFKRLYHAGPEDYREAVAVSGDPHARIMVVSHNPGSEVWTWQLCGQHETLPTAAIAMLEFDEGFQWSKIRDDSSANLLDVWRPKEVL
ncbi:MAG: SixA phosphatase family protein [Pirellulaceae bacterium]